MEIAKGDGTTLDIKLINPVPVQYCTGEKRVAESLIIEGNPNIVGMKISFSGGYIASEDELVYTGSLQKSWSAASGTLLLTGISTTTVQEYVDAIKTVTYKNNKAIPTLGVRKITISLSDIDYLPETQHFYRFISKPGIKWTDAKAEAESDAMMYYGLRGYLATITSQVENDFIRTKTKGVGWIGASDAAVEGDWRWVTGPEGLNGGLLFWRGTGYQAKTNPAVYGPVNGAYHNWNRWDTPYSSSLATGTWEPNQSGVENYAHITYFPGNANDSFKWNDLPNGGSNGDYVPAGYLIEFGGSQGDPPVNLMATLDLQVNTVLFKTGTIPVICEGTSVTLNQADTTKATYSWTPTESLSSPIVANPVASPKIPTKYFVTGTRGICIDTATFTVPVNPKPVSLLKPEENICAGSNKILDPGVHQSYNWGNNVTTQTITVNTAGDYTVTLTSDKNCTATSTSKVVVHEYPTIDLSKLQPLICGEPKSTTVKITTTGTDYLLTSADGKANVSGGLNVDVSTFGIYPMIYKSSFYPSCSVEKLFDLSFYKKPIVNFSIDSTACYHYNLDAKYIGDADTIKARFTWVFGGDTIVDGIGRIKERIPLGVNQSKRDLVLIVEQNGCSDKHTLPDIRVIPTLSIFVKDTLRCQPDAFEFLAANTETGVTYDWDFGDGITGKGIKALHTFAKSGKYDIQLTVTTDKKCSNTALIKDMVFAAPIPDVAFSLSPIDCLEPGANEMSYTGLIGTDKDTYNWNLNSFDLTEIITNPLQTKGPLKFDLKNKPSVTLSLKVMSEYGCPSALTSITLKRKPDFSIASDLTAGCIPFSPLLTGIINDKVDRINFTWDFGDGTIVAGSPMSHIYNVPDKKYNITLSGTSLVTGCSNKVTIPDFLQTYPKPKAAFSMDNTVVYNDKPDVKFTNLSEGATAFNWDFGDGTTSPEPRPLHHFVKTGHLIVLLEVTNADFCTDTVSQKLLVAFDRLFPPTGFSPNAPKEVDRIFKLNSEGLTPEGYQFTVLSRWNDLVFEAKDEIKGWDGRLKNGTLAPAGSYVWILSFTDFLGRKHRQTGTVTLVY
ncbi:MAG: PKD domain-containing protein [Bacteroidia bacterium]|nr:PKD domain-containing protein [Bacteroidia bacterium]